MYYVNVEALHYHEPAKPQQCVVNVLSTFHPLTQPDVAVLALLYHVQYHLQLGINPTVMYVTPQFLPALFRSQGVQVLLASGHLHFVLWDDFPGIDLGPELGPYWSQGLQYSHGLLWNWGTGCYTAFTDLDEYLTYDDMAHQSLISHLHKLSSNFSRVVLVRQNMLCASCHVSDFQSWFGEQHSARPIELYNTTGIIHTNLFGKQIVHPSWVYGWNVHRGWDFPGGPPKLVPESVWVRHIVNMSTLESDVRPNHEFWHTLVGIYIGDLVIIKAIVIGLITSEVLAECVVH